MLKMNTTRFNCTKSAFSDAQSCSELPTSYRSDATFSSSNRCGERQRTDLSQLIEYRGSPVIQAWFAWVVFALLFTCQMRADVVIYSRSVSPHPKRENLARYSSLST